MQEEEMRQDIVKKLGIESLPQKEQDELIDQVNEAILGRVMYETMEKLSEENTEILKKKIEDETSTSEEIHEFLKNNIENYDDFVNSIVDDFFKEMEEATADYFNETEA